MLLVKFRCRRCFRTWRWTEMNEWEPWTATCGYVGCVLWMSHKEETWTEEEVFLQFFLECLHVSVVALVSQGFVDHANVSGVGSTLLKMGKNISPLTTVNWKPLQMQHDLVELWPSWQLLSWVWGRERRNTKTFVVWTFFPCGFDSVEMSCCQNRNRKSAAGALVTTVDSQSWYILEFI